MPEVSSYDILNCEDPVDDMTTWLLDIMYEEPEFIACASQLVLRDMGLHPKSMLGGDQSDKDAFLAGLTEDYETLVVPDFIMEGEPRYDLYWERLNNLINLVLANAVARQKSRFTLETHRNRQARQLGAAFDAERAGEDGKNG